MHIVGILLWLELAPNICFIPRLVQNGAINRQAHVSVPLLHGDPCSRHNVLGRMSYHVIMQLESLRDEIVA